MEIQSQIHGFIASYMFQEEGPLLSTIMMRLFLKLRYKSPCATLLKKRVWHKYCYHVDFVKFLRTQFLQVSYSLIYLAIFFSSLKARLDMFNLKVSTWQNARSKMKCLAKPQLFKTPLSPVFWKWQTSATCSQFFKNMLCQFQNLSVQKFGKVWLN